MIGHERSICQRWASYYSRPRRRRSAEIMPRHTMRAGRGHAPLQFTTAPILREYAYCNACLDAATPTPHHGFLQCRVIAFYISSLLGHDIIISLLRYFSIRAFRVPHYLRMARRTTLDERKHGQYRSRYYTMLIYQYPKYFRKGFMQHAACYFFTA